MISGVGSVAAISSVTGAGIFNFTVTHPPIRSSSHDSKKKNGQICSCSLPPHSLLKEKTIIIIKTAVMHAK